MSWAGHVARLVDIRNAHEVSVGKTDGKRTLWVPRSRWKVNNEVDRQEIEWWLVLGLDWSGSGYGEVAGSCECDNERPGSIWGGGFLD